MAETATTPRKNLRLSVQDVLNQGKHLYVRNILNPRGAVFILMPDGNNMSPMTFPPCPHPIDLSEMFTERSLLDSNDLRKAIFKGALAIVDSDVAEEELNKPGVIEQVRYSFQQLTQDAPEVKRWKAGAFEEQEDEDVSAKAATRKIKSTNDIPVYTTRPASAADVPVDASIAGADDDELRSRMQRSPIRVQPATLVNPQVTLILDQLSQDNLNATDAFMKLSGMADLLSENDWTYVMSNTTSQKIRSFAAERLASLKGLDSNE